MRRNIGRTAIILLSMFLLLIMYLSYINLYRGPKILGHVTNKRTITFEKEIKRGTITDSTGTVLAKSLPVNNGFQRQYPFGMLYSHIIGYTSLQLGRTGIESSYNSQLLGLTGSSEARNFFNRLRGAPMAGDNLTLTLQHNLQGIAYRLLGNRRGAIVLLNPNTGAILALATTPSYDANRVEDQWEQLKNSEEFQLLNRATSGLYPPGSTLKVMTAAGALQQIPGVAQKNFYCPGYLQIGNYRLKDLGVHGSINLYDAIINSCNTTFGQLGMVLGAKGLEEVARQFQFGKSWELPIPSQPSRFPKRDKLDAAALAQTGIGQGEVLVTPLHMALITATIANGGKMPSPYLVQEIKGSDGKTIWQAQPKMLTEVIKEQEANYLQAAMTGVVDKGTGTRAQISGIKVAGKTGSAENPHGQSHAWFIGYAPAEKPQVAVAVILENAGFGGSQAAPLAGQLMAAALR